MNMVARPIDVTIFYAFVCNEMFDPCYVGLIPNENVKVTTPFGHSKNGKTQMFKAIVTIESNMFALLLKPNEAGKRDQIVADRLKHLFNLKPMNCFALQLKFVVVEGVQIDSPAIEYIAMPCPFLQLTYEHQALPTLSSWTGQRSKAFDVELLKIAMFRYIIGTTKSLPEHILIVEGMPLSISEMVISSFGLPSDFMNILSFDHWEEARDALVANFDNDQMRGIILQTERCERLMFHRSAKGPLSLPAMRITEIIEERVDLISSCTLDQLKLILAGK